MNLSKMLAGEMLISMGIQSFQALKQSQVPHPGNLVRTAAAFGIIGCVGFIDEDIAALLGAGFLIALLIAQVGGGWEGLAAVPGGGDYTYLSFGGSEA